MEEGRRGNNLFPLSLVAVLVTLAGYFMYSSPLKSRRPEASGVGTTLTPHAGHMRAHLWEDPFKVVSRHEHQVDDQHRQALRDKFLSDLASLFVPAVNGRKPLDFEDLAERIHECVDQDDDRARCEDSYLHVLMVMVPCSPSAEDHEVRVRSRRALHAALHASAYVSDEPRGLDLVRLKWSETACSGSDPAPSNISRSNTSIRELPDTALPYELFQTDRVYSSAVSSPWQHSKTVLVLWVNNTAFADHPLIRLAQVISELKRAIRPGDSQNAHAPCEIRFDVIGPSNSDTLQAMLRDAQELSLSKAGESDKPTSWPRLHTSTEPDEAEICISKLCCSLRKARIYPSVAEIELGGLDKRR